MDEDDTGATGLRIAVSGACGSMGKYVCAAVENDDELVLAARVDPNCSDPPHAFQGVPYYSELSEALAREGIQVVIDFTVPSSVLENVLTCIAHRVPAVVGTTGLTAEGLEEIRRRAKEKGIPVLVAPNFALGAVLMMEFARQAARHYSDCEIIELHHPAKLDAPSGTARRTADLIGDIWEAAGQGAKQVSTHSVRLPGLVAHQEVIFGGLGETLTIRHDSLSRESFMPGVVLAAKRVSELQGLTVGLENIL